MHRSLFKESKQQPENSATADKYKYELTLAEATGALSSTGKWDKNLKTENITARCKSLNAVHIQELKISKMPIKINDKKAAPSSSHIYAFFELLSKNSHVKTLDLSSHEFDRLSLVYMAHALEQKFMTNNNIHTLKKIILAEKQPHLTSDIKAHLSEASNKCKIEFGFVSPTLDFKPKGK